MTEAQNDWAEERCLRLDAVRGSAMLRDAILRHLHPAMPIARVEAERPKRIARKKVKRIRRKPLPKCVGLPPRPDADPRIERIKKLVADHFGINRAWMEHKCRHRSVTRPRHIAIYLARKTGASLPKVGRHFNRDHSTVLHAIRMVEADFTMLAAAQRLVDMGENPVSTLRNSLGHGIEQAVNNQPELMAA